MPLITAFNVLRSRPWQPMTEPINDKLPFWVAPGQQPISRVVGKRVPPPPGTMPSLASRQAMDSHLRYRTRAPKGVFFYRNPETMSRDRERWRIETAVARQRPGPETTHGMRPATWEDLKQLARWLDEAQAEHALVGGYARNAHGITRVTEDIDLVVNPAAENSARWIAALSRMPDRIAQELAASPDVFADGETYALRIHDELPVDVMPALGGRSWAELSGHIQTLDLDGIPLRVLTMEGLLLTLQGAAPKEQMHAQAVQSAIDWVKSHPRPE